VIDLFRLKSSFLDDLFVNSVLIRFIFFCLFGAYGPNHTKKVNELKDESTDVIGALRDKSSKKDDLFVNSDLIRLIFFSVIFNYALV
jgi:hypothetical protein